MANGKKTKIYVETKKKSNGNFEAVTRVVDPDTGETITTHSSEGNSAEDATANALSDTYEEYDNPAGATDAEGNKYKARGSPVSMRKPPRRKPRTKSSKAKKDPKSKAGGLKDLETPPKKPKEYMTKGDPRNHLEWPEPEFDGQGGEKNPPPWHSSLHEPVPKFVKRPGDKQIIGNINNNASIIIGRDRSGRGERITKLFQHTHSGYSNHMGAGAIDIVCGRMAPFPVEMTGNGPAFVHPMFTTLTSEDVPELKALTLIDGRGHPGFMMDAARIYISQMTDVDLNFGIARGGSPQGTIPSSGIVLKADQVRLYARKDIKIVTAGSEEPWDSQGNELTRRWGIHLMAGNGEAGYQQPIPKGNSLTTALIELVTLIDGFIGVFDGVVKSQMEYNGVLLSHFHQSPLYGAPTSPSITAVPFGTKVLIDHFARAVAGNMFMKVNLAGYRNKYLTRGGDSYINSLWNTTN